MALNSFNGNLLVEDSSPLISYEPAGSWTDSPNDSSLATYSGNSYHVTSSHGATATFTFVGTGVSILGGHRPNYGTYTVSVDGQNPQTSTSQANQASTGQSLFTMNGLNYGSHTVVLTNTGGAPVDIDAIEFQTTGGPSGTTMVPKDFDDTDPAMTYQPSAAVWTARQDPRFSGDTLHFTNTPGASASMKFSGQAVAVYGTVSPDHADIVVNLDGQQGAPLPGGANGFASQVHPNVLLFYRGDLDGSEHTITMSGDARAGTGPFIDLDRITVFSASGSPAGGVASSSLPVSTTATGFSTTLASVSPTASATAAAEITTAPSPSNAQNLSANGSGSHKSTGLIIGCVLGGVGLIFVVVATAILLCLRRRRQRTKRLHKSMISVSPVLPMQDKPITPILPMQRASSPTSRDAEKDGAGGGNLRVENPAFPFPAAFPLTPKRSLASLSSRYPASVVRSDTVSSHSRGPSELSNGSSGSAAPLVTQNVPVIRVNAPQPRPSIARKPAPGSGPSGMVRAPTSPPVRPTNRPPTMDFARMNLED